MNLSNRAGRIFAFLLTLLVLPAGAVGAAEAEMEFYGNQHFRLKSPGGKVISINPWIKGNKDAPFGVEHYKKGEVDLILATAGHGDDKTVLVIARPASHGVASSSFLGIFRCIWTREKSGLSKSFI